MLKMTKNDERTVSSFLRHSSFACRVRSEAKAGALSFPVRHHTAPKTLRPPDTSSKAFQLHDLAVIDKQIHVHAIIFDVPRKHVGIGGFEHKLVHPEFTDEFRRDICAPWFNIFSNAFAFDHNDLGAGIEKSLCLRDGPVWIARAFGF